MADSSWKVDVDGRSHTITVQTDAELGRAAIRVDGRAAARPMTADDQEREVPIGGTRYLVRRLHDGTFDLDLAPIALDPALHATVIPAREKKSGSSTWKWITVAAIVVIIGLFGRTGWSLIRYSGIRWVPYSAPDETFKALFAGTPAEETQRRNLSGEVWQFNQLSSQYRDHRYVIEYIDVNRVLTSAGARPLIADYLERWTNAIGGAIVSQEETTVVDNPSIKFTATISNGSDMTIASGVVAIRNKRVFFVYTLAPENQKSLPDLRKFVSSFVLPPPPAPVTKLSS